MVVVWLVIAIGLGFFAPKAEHALPEPAGSDRPESVDACDRRSEFGGMSSRP